MLEQSLIDCIALVSELKWIDQMSFHVGNQQCFMENQHVGLMLDGTIISHSCSDNGDAFDSVHSISKPNNSDGPASVLHDNTMVLGESTCVCMGVSLHPDVLVGTGWVSRVRWVLLAALPAATPHCPG